MENTLTRVERCMPTITADIPQLLEDAYHSPDAIRCGECLSE